MRLRLPQQVDDDGEPDENDSDELERVAEPPTELLVIEQDGAGERGSEPGEAADNDQVEAAAAVAARALPATAAKCSPLESETWSRPKKCRSAGGKIAPATVSAAGKSGIRDRSPSYSAAPDGGI